MLKIIEKFIGFLKNRYQRHYREEKFHLAVDIALALIILILMVFIISIKFSDFSYKNKLVVKIIPASETIVSGREARFEIKYTNASKFNLLKTKFSLNLPEDFILEEVSPSNFFDQRTNSFEAGDLMPGANGTIKIKGIVIGAVGSGGKIILNAYYLLNQEFSSELFAGDFVIGSSSLELKWDNAGVLYHGQPTAMSLGLENISQFNLNNLEFDFLGSDVYLGVEADDKNIEIINNRLKIKQIKSGAGLKVNFNLTYDGDSDTVGIRLVGRGTINNKIIKQVDLAEIFTVEEPDLSIKINSVQSVVGIDDDVVYEVFLKNLGPKDINNLVLDLSPGSSRHSLKSVKMKNSLFIRLAGNQIIFDKNLHPSESQEIELTVKFFRPEIFINDEVRLKVAARYNIDGTAFRAYYFSNPAKIKTTYQFKAETRYFSAYGDQLGVGPIPPVAGIPTKYWIFWQFKNRGNELANLRVSADLPSGIIWSDESSVNKGDLTFDQQQNTLIWRVDTVASQEENCRLALALTIIPDIGNAKQDILLLKNIKYDFFDNFTREDIMDSAGSLTNDLSGDSYALIMEKQNIR